MMLTARFLGLIIGFLAGLMFIIAGWRAFLILIAFSVAGYLVGAWWESEEGMGERLHDLYQRLFHP